MDKYKMQALAEMDQMRTDMKKSLRDLGEEQFFLLPMLFEEVMNSNIKADLKQTITNHLTHSITSLFFSLGEDQEEGEL